jgi:hypothetical protein
LSAAARDAVIRGKMVDQTHFPNRGPDTLSKARDLGMRGPPLDPKRNDHVNAIMRASGSPSNNRPTVGQIVAAGLTGNVKG